MIDHHDRTSESIDGSSSRAEDETDVGAGDDVLSDVLDTIRLRGAVFFFWEPRWPYATSVPDGSTFAPLVMPGADQIVSYHVVTEGPCWGAVGGEPPLRLDTGDILLIPRGDAYVISNQPCQPTSDDDEASREFFRMMAAGELAPIIRDGGPGPDRNRLICGFLGCNLHPFNPLMSTLPRLMRLPAGAASSDSLLSLIDIAMGEINHGNRGRRSVLTRLSELMFVEAIRRHLRTQDADGHGWLRGLNDPLIGRALTVLHMHLARPWTLDSLADAVGSSRSTLAERFASVVGETPMQYLAQWRMQVAARALTDTRKKVYTVAREVGYESEAAFSRAFKRLCGITPARWRARRTSSEGSAPIPAGRAADSH